LKYLINFYHKKYRNNSTFRIFLAFTITTVTPHCGIMVNITWHFIFKSGVELQVTKPSYEWLQKRKNLGVGEILIKGLKRSVRSLEQYGDNI
jgi:hypothetical protein